MALTYPLVRETAAPWYVRQVEYEGVAILLSERSLMNETARRYHVAPTPYAVAWGRLPWESDHACDYRHQLRKGALVWEGESYAEAEAAFAELERKLLAGELS